MSNKQKIFILLLCIGVGFLVGYNTPRTSWETKYIPVEYDAPKNTEACDKLGGYIMYSAAFKQKNRVYGKFECFIPEKIVDINKPLSNKEDIR